MLLRSDMQANNSSGHPESCQMEVEHAPIDKLGGWMEELIAAKQVLNRSREDNIEASKFCCLFILIAHSRPRAF